MHALKGEGGKLGKRVMTRKDISVTHILFKSEFLTSFKLMFAMCNFEKPYVLQEVSAIAILVIYKASGASLQISASLHTRERNQVQADISKNKITSVHTANKIVNNASVRHPSTDWNKQSQS